MTRMWFNAIYINQKQTFTNAINKSSVRRTYSDCQICLIHFGKEQDDSLVCWITSTISSWQSAQCKNMARIDLRTSYLVENRSPSVRRRVFCNRRPGLPS